MAIREEDVFHDDSSEDISTNPTNSKTFAEIASEHLTRRSILQGSLAVAATTFLAPAPADAAGFKRGKSLAWGQNKKKSLVGFKELTFDEIAAAEGKMVTVSSDYEYQTLIPWGTPIDPNSGIAEYTGDPNTRPTAYEQENMIGIGHDGMFFYPSNLKRVLRAEMRRGRKLPARARKRVLDSRCGYICVNHEFGNNFHVLGKPAPENIEDVRLSQAAHGVSVVKVRENWRGKWEVVSDRNNRRITVNTPMDVSGPVAGSDLLKNAAGNEVKGTVNNCGSGETPWGTYLTCEENFNGYFGTDEMMYGGDDVSELQNIAYGRYGITAGSGYQWYKHDPRFDIGNKQYLNECNRFGWIVEIDPFDGTKKPVKRTALGRFKHEAATIKELDDGRIAVYMGDDQRGDYCYKFESSLPWRAAIASGLSPLDEGKLYVARFDGDAKADGGDGVGTGEWIELTIDNADIRAAGFSTQEEVLVFARMAADAVGATPMDRPEWCTLGTNGEIYWTLTNNDRKDSGQGALSEVNPIFENSDGYIIKTTDKSTTRFDWSMFMIARNSRPDNPGDDPNDFDYAIYDAPADGGANVFTDPDAAWADEYGRLFIGTDGGQPTVNGVPLNDQMVVFDTNTGDYKRLLMGVNSDEITGCTVTPDYGTLFTNTQHPGDGNPAATSFPAAPDSGLIPRDCTIVVRRKDGGQVGS